MSLPAGITRISINGQERLATQGKPIGSEPVKDGWRAWDPSRSKVSAMIEVGLDAAPHPDETVLYLGAGAGTTASHIADVTGPVYAIEFAPRPARELVAVADHRARLLPLLKDVRHPETYAHIVEAEIDLIVQDVATRGQANVALANRRFLAPDGRLVMAIKARSEEVTAAPDEVYETAVATLDAKYNVQDQARLDPYHDDHLGLIATPR